MASGSTIECLLREQNEALSDFFAGGGGGGAATPGGAVNSIQFNNAGALDGFGTWADGGFEIPGYVYATDGIYTTDAAFEGKVDILGSPTTAGVSAFRVRGTVFSGAGAVPHAAIVEGGATSAWSTLGTMLGINAPAGFAGNLIDAQVNGVTKAKITSTGQVVVAGGAFNIPALTFLEEGNSGIYRPGNFWLGFSAAGTPTMSMNHLGTSIMSGGFLAWSSGYPYTSANDLFLNRLGPASLRLGNAPSATPLAQTLTLGEASRPGTDVNISGGIGRIRSGLGTGTNASNSTLEFLTPDPVASGSAVQTYGIRLNLNSQGAHASRLNVGILAGGADAIFAAGPISITTWLTEIMDFSGGFAATLANGVLGQLKFIIVNQMMGPVVLSPGSTHSYLTITFTAVGSSVLLQYTSMGWAIVSFRNVTIA